MTAGLISIGVLVIIFLLFLWSRTWKTKDTYTGPQGFKDIPDVLKWLKNNLSDDEAWNLFQIREASESPGQEIIFFSEKHNGQKVFLTYNPNDQFHWVAYVNTETRR